MRGTTFRNWDSNLGKATWLVNIKGSTNRTGPAQSELPHTVEWDKIPVVQMKNVLGKTVWVTRALGEDKPIHGIAFTQRHGYTLWVMLEDGGVQCVPQEDLILGENTHSCCEL